MSIQPANKAAEHLISSYDQYWKKKQTEAVNAYVIKNSKGEGEKRKRKKGEKKKKRLSQAVGMTGRSIMGVQNERERER